MFRQAPSFPYHELGIVEDGTTASRAISKDSYVIWKGSSYFASTDILQGATLEEDVNLTAIPDGVINGVVSALNNKTVQVTGGTGITVDQPLTKIGNTVFGSLKLAKPTEWGHGSWINGVAQLASDYPPSEQLFSGMSGLAQNVMFRISTTGQVDIYNFASANISGAFAVIAYRLS